MSEGHDDYAVEPIRGLPQALPQGETILWQGAPQMWEIAKRVFHIRLAALYLLGLTAWRFRVHLETQDLRHAVIATLSVLTIAVVGLGLLALLAALVARTSVYTITNRRVVMRIGIALPTAINIPFSHIGSAGLRTALNGTGDISLALTGTQRMAWSNFWPHVRPWAINQPQPTLRGIADVQAVAQLLGEALARELPAGTLSETAIRPVGRPSQRPAAVMGGQPA